MTFCQIVGTMAAHDVFYEDWDTNAATQAGFAAQLSCQFQQLYAIKKYGLN
jgi:hypothetical protein